MTNNIKPPIVIAIDGPAAAGKGTLARKIARHYDFAYLDTGKLYRLVAYNLLQTNTLLTAENAAKSASSIASEIPFATMDSPDLLNEEVGKAASTIASFAELRKALISLQQDFAASPYTPKNHAKITKQGAVIDGRDIGSIICPNANAKLYITATVEIRAQRRMLDFGTDANYAQILADMQKRDTKDSQRTHAPLAKAHDAITIDTTSLSINEALKACLNALKNKLKF